MPGALVSGLAAIAIEGLLRLAVEAPMTLDDLRAPRLSSATWEGLWPGWMPAHPETRKRINDLSTQLSALNAELKQFLPK